MSRGLLSKRELQNINKDLPDIAALHRRVLSLSPDFISIKFHHESDIPIAAVCLQDATESVAEARYALHEILAHRLWYLEKRKQPIEESAIFFSRYYADDIALRLYAAGEHLAKAIVCMLELKKAALEPYRKNKVSLQGIVGRYLIKEMPDHPVTIAVTKLVKSKEWPKTISYRNEWVHDKPPTVEGMGIVYERGRRWQRVDSGLLLTFGGGDKPKHTAEEIISFVRPSLFLFTEVLDDVTNYFLEILKDAGIEFSMDELSVSM
jgi:hypothetical protein